MSVNSVTLTGNITRDAELHQTSATGTSVLNFSIAVNDRRRNSSTGEWEDHANFFDITVFGKRAETIHTWCTKGTKVAIEGNLRQNTWKDKETGQNRSRVTVIANEIDFMSRGGNGGGNRSNGGGSSQPTPADTTPAASNDFAGGNDYDDDDVPF